MRVQKVSVKHTDRSQSRRVTDVVAVEEPLEIRLQYWFKDSVRNESLAVTMRSPGNDRELVAGLLYAEGVAQDTDEILEIRSLGSPNEILAELSKDVDVESRHVARAFMTNSSCGICGTRYLERLELSSRIDVNDSLRIQADTIYKLPAILRSHQEGFTQTGGLHAALLLGLDGSPIVHAAFEDIGRHNALDKLIGDCLLKKKIPLSHHLLLLSSRGSFELVQKAVRAGAPILATIGSPSSLAIDAARRCGLTLVGFVREDRFNVYTGDWRINS